MTTRDLLPGVTDTVAKPAVVCDSRKTIRRARLAAAVRDTVQAGLLVAVDWMFVRWPAAHVPGMARPASVAVVVLLNVLLAAQTWLSRMWPTWRARRIAATWCAAERARFFTAAQRQRHGR